MFVRPAYVNKGALLFCSAAHQNLFRIRNLILPRALHALDQSAHLQIWAQINAAVLWASALFLHRAICGGPGVLCSCHITGRVGELVGGGGRGGVGTPAGRDKCAGHGRKSKRSRGYLPNFKSIQGGKPGCYSHLNRKI